MTPHLHPRSRATTSIFGTTLLVSFLVVGMPHIIPCPAPRVKLADSKVDSSENGQKRQRLVQSGPARKEPESREQVDDTIPLEEQNTLRKIGHECPVPKPTGFFGRVLGFNEPTTEEKATQRQVQVAERRKTSSR